jgi:hypothetical protein
MLYDEESGTYPSFENLFDLTNARVSMYTWRTLNRVFGSPPIDRLSLAARVLKEAEATGTHTPILEGMKQDYEALLEHCYSDRDIYLQNILDKAQTYFDIEIPEPALLPILSLILLPAPLRRRQ